MQLVFLGFLITKAFALFAGIYYFKRLPTPYRLVLAVVAMAIFVESCGHYLRLLHQENSWLFNFYIPIEVILLGIAGMYFLPSRKAKMTTAVFIVINTIIWAVNIAINSVNVLANYSVACGALLLTVLYFSVLFANSLFSTGQIYKQPLFWLAVSNILYFSCVVPFFALFHYMTQLRIGNELATINTILNFIRYPLVGVSFILLGREQLQTIKSA